MRISLVIASLAVGGAQRVLSLMANHWDKAGHEMEIVTLDPPGSTPFFPLNHSVIVRPLGLASHNTGLWSRITANLTRIHGLRRTIRNFTPDTVISFVDQTNVLTLLACRPLKVPVIVSERTNPRHHHIGLVWNLMRAKTYPKADAIVVQTQAVLNELPKAQRCKAVVIPNPVAILAQNEPHPALPPRPLVVAAGRLSHEKGFDLLLQAFAKTCKHHPDWTLVVLGDGPEREPLTKLAQNLGLAKHVTFLGLVTDVAGVFANSNIFVLPSRYEGFPNAMCEAMACGLPCVAFDCPSGPGEIIEHGKNGLLVPAKDVSKMSTALDQLMGDANLQNTLAAQARNVSQRFNLDTVTNMWEALLG